MASIAFSMFSRGYSDEFINFPMKPWLKILPKSAKFAEKTMDCPGLVADVPLILDPGTSRPEPDVGCPTQLEKLQKNTCRYMSQIYGHLEKNEMIQMMMNYDS